MVGTTSCAYQKHDVTLKGLEQHHFPKEKNPLVRFLAALFQTRLTRLVEDDPSKGLCIFEVLLPSLPTRHLRCKLSYLLT